MTYLDGFVIAVPKNRREDFIKHARTGDPVFMENGAIRIRECWGEDVPHGKLTDFYRAVQAKDDETVVFSWIEWPDKATRDAGMAATMQSMETDPRVNQQSNPMPFDGMRMIYGGFDAIVEDGPVTEAPWTQGFIVAVPADNKQAYRDAATYVWNIARDYGATRIVEAWGDDVPAGKVTDFSRSVNATDNENVVFSFIEWPSRETCEKASAKMMEDERMKTPDDFVMPFDGKRMVYGGFEPVVSLGA